MSTHAYTQNAEKKADGLAYENYVPYGREMQTAIMLGLGLGGGLSALRLLRDRLSQATGMQLYNRDATTLLPPKPKKRKPDYRFQIPDSFEKYTDDLDSPRSKKSAVEKTAALDNLDMLLPLLGVGAGGLYGAVSSKPGQKLKGILRGAAGGGAAGLVGNALRSDFVADQLGRIVAYPSTLLGTEVPDAKNLPPRASDPFTAIGNTLSSTLNHPSIDMTHAALRLPASILAGVGSAAGANALLEKMRVNDLRSRREKIVHNAREEYFNALLGDAENKNKKTASLNTLYEKYAAGEKTAAGSWSDYIGELLGLAGRSIGSYSGTSAVIGGLLAGPYMYQRAKNDGARRAMARAQEDRKRYRSRHTPWIDPEELAAIAKIGR